MKPKNIQKVFFVLITFLLLTLFSKFTYSQSFPKEGATWIFKTFHPTWMDDYAEKWEYIGDSVVTDGVIKKMKVTTKVVNDFMNPDVTSQNIFYVDFLYKGDTIWDTRDTIYPIANFSLQTGDSTFSPYYSSLSMLYQLTDSNNNCSQNDSALFFQKAVVVENGTETEDGLTYRYYKLKYLSDDIHNQGDTIIQKFSERSILNQGYYWHNAVFQACNVVAEGSPNVLLCYKDDFSPDSSCSAIACFDALNVENVAQEEIKVFPNPVSGNTINIHSNESLLNTTIRILDFQGKEIYVVQINQNTQNTFISIPPKSAGFYLLQLQNHKGLINKKIHIMN